MLTRSRWLARILPVTVLLAGSALAQGTSSITGVVTDASTHEPVAGAVVVVTSPALGAERTAVSEEGGRFAVPELPPGDYAVSVQLDGYKPFERSDLRLKEAITLRVNVAVTPEAVQVEEVVVTGSRIRRKDLTTPAPVTVLDRAQLAETGKVTIGDILRTLPEQTGGATPQVNNGGDGSSTVDLRGLGAQRTLVLLNGRRMVKSASAIAGYETVDLGAIPTAAIERIEILKDGGSSVYGSDAIAGVVNIVTRRRFDGAEASVQYGSSARGDGRATDVSLIAGTSGDRGGFLIAGGYGTQDPVWARRRGRLGTIQAKNYTTGEVTANGSAATPAGYFELDGPCDVASNPACAALAAQPNDAGSYVGTAWTPDPAVAGFPAGVVGAREQHESDRYNTQSESYLYTPDRRLQLWASGEYRLGESARLYAEASFVNRRSRQAIAPEPLFTYYLGDGSITISPDSLYNPYGVGVIAGRRLEEFGLRSTTQESNTYRVVTGLDGTLADWAGPLRGWAWDVSLTYAANNATNETRGSLRASRVVDAIGPSMIDPASGQPICVRTPGDPSTRIAGCVPLNLLGGAGSITKDQVAGLAFDGTDQASWSMSSLEVNTNGELFKLLSVRPVSLAAGYELRREWGEVLPDPIAASGDSTGNNYLASEPGGYDVHSGYAELSVPILSGRPLVEDLEATGSLRASHYSNFGDNTTYKLGARWSPVRDVTLRGTFSTAFRAPSVLELHAGAGDTYETAADPCADGVEPGSALAARCGAAANNGNPNEQIRAKAGGNSALKPEEARVWTVGAVYEPRQVQGLSFTVDYYAIEVRRTISSIGAQAILDGCYVRGVQRYCDLVTRDVNGYVSTLNDTNMNVGKMVTAGVDVAGRYDLQNTPIGRFRFGVDVNVLQKFDQTLPDGTVMHLKGTADGITPGVSQGGAPWKAVASVVWAAPAPLEGLGAGLDTRYVAAFKECGTAEVDGDDSVSDGGACFVDDTHSRTVNAYNQWNGFVSYDLSSKAGKTSLMLGVSNLFDTKPPIIYSETYTNSDGTNYDFMGRYYYVRLSHRI